MRKKNTYKAQKRDGSKGVSKRHEVDVLKEAHSIYGLHACKAALLNPKRHIKKVFITKDNPLLKDEDCASLLADLPCIFVQRQDIDDKIAGAGVVHQNVLFHVEPLAEKTLDRVLKDLEGEEVSHFILLDQVSDPHNIGAILRSARVFGAHGVIVQEKNAPQLNATMCKIACGAAEDVPYIREVNLSRSLELLQEAGYWCLGLDEWGEKTLREAVKGVKKIVLVMGAEGPGLRPLVKKKCDELTRLKTVSDFSSLNVSNASAIALYETFEHLYS